MPPARTPIEGINRDALVDGLRARGHRQVVPLADRGDLARTVADLASAGDLVVCLGAGNITHWAHALPGRDRRLAAALRGSGGMMAAAPATPARLIERLPPVRGRYSRGRAAGADHLVPRRRSGRGDVPPGRRATISRPSSPAKPADVPVTVIGVGSNLLVRDGGVPGVVVRLGRGFADIAAEGDDDRRRRRRARRQRRAVAAAMPASPAWSSSPAFPAPSAARCA